MKGEARVFEWKALSPQSLEQSLNGLEQEEEGVVRKTWISKMGAVRCWGNEISKSLIQA